MKPQVQFGLLFCLVWGGLQANLRAQGAESELITPRTEQVIAKSLLWLASRQNEDGSYGATREYTQTIGLTSLSGLAFLASGSVPEAGPYAMQVNGCLNYMTSRSQANGYLVDGTHRTHGPMYGHGFGTMFLAEAYGMTNRPELREQLKRAVNLIVFTQNAQGGWRYLPVPEDADISVTVCQMMALRAARNAGVSVPKEVMDRGVNYIKKCQNPDGGFRYRIFDPAESRVARSSAALVALYTAGITEDPAILKGFEYLKAERHKGTDRDYYFYAQYYSMQAYWHAGSPLWPEFYKESREQLLESLQEDHWEDSVIGDEYATAMALIALQIPRNLVPIFER